VQAERANNLESQMAQQINEIKERQARIAELNQLLADIRALRPSGDDPNKSANLGENNAKAKEMLDRLKAAGVTIKTSTDDAGRVYEDKGMYSAKQISFDKWIEELKGKLDALNNTAQLDMIRLQSLSNKRNEAFEQLTNFIQKIAKSKESVIGNMR